MRSVISFAAFALVASIMVPRYVMQSDHHGAEPALAATTPGGSASTDSRSVVVRPNRQGHFQVEGRIDGRRLSFMIDTGASVIALTADDAASLGLHPAQHDFRALMQTANGKVYAAPVELNLVEIEDVAVHHVPAIVMPPAALAGNLLGMSFLSRLHRWEFADGRLVLEQ
jgi:aspartyl protease family protein